MNYFTIIILATTTFTVLIIHNNRIERLEKQIKLTHYCSRVIAVMTPEGHVTSVCAP